MAKSRMNLTLDMADRPQLLEMLRLAAVTERTTQKQIVIEALEAHFSHKQENRVLLDAATLMFAFRAKPQNPAAPKAAAGK